MEALGINGVLLVAQITSFLVLFFVFSRFLYPQVRKALQNRRDTIKKIYDDNLLLEQKLKNAEDLLSTKKAEAEALARQITDKAKKDGEIVKQEIVLKAHEEGQRQISQANVRIKRQESEIKTQLAAQAKNLTQQMLSTLLEEKAQDPKWQKSKLTETLASLK